MEWIRRASRCTPLWPGLDGVWQRGSFVDLGIAVAFAALLNGMLISSWWPSAEPIRSVQGGWLAAGWACVAGAWVWGVWRAVRRAAVGEGRGGRNSQEDLFIQAQTEYLKGHWVETQALLERQIRRDPGDVESHLLLSSVYRRAGRRDLSRRQLLRAQGFPGAQRWRSEIDRELKRLAARPSTDT